MDILYAFLSDFARVKWAWPNILLCISRDGALTNQQLPCSYSLGVTKSGFKKRSGELVRNVRAQSS